MRARHLLLLAIFVLPSFASATDARPRAPTLERDGARFESRTRGGVAYDVVWVDAKKADLRLHWKDASGAAYQTLDNARNAIAAGGGRRFFMATNSGIFDRAYEPLGLHVEDGRTLKRLNRSHASRGNFFMNPNGVFFIAPGGAPGVMESAAFARAKPAAAFATQSGPLLVNAGELHPAFREGSDNRRLRSGVGVTASGLAAFAISTRAVNFYDFAAFFRDELGCANALYLDGDISSLVRSAEPTTQFMPFVGIWTASARAR